MSGSPDEPRNVSSPSPAPVKLSKEDEERIAERMLPLIRRRLWGGIAVSGLVLTAVVIPAGYYFIKEHTKSRIDSSLHELDDRVKTLKETIDVDRGRYGAFEKRFDERIKQIEPKVLEADQSAARTGLLPIRAAD